MNSIYDPITNKRHSFLSKKGLYMLFELCNKDKKFVKGQPWYEQQIVPLLEETDSIS